MKSEAKDGGGGERMAGSGGTVRQKEGDESKLACRTDRRERENRGWKGEEMGQDLS